MKRASGAQEYERAADLRDLLTDLRRTTKKVNRFERMPYSLPLALDAEKDLAEYAQARAFPIIPCTLCGSQDNLQRKRIGEMIAQWEKAEPGRVESIVRALSDVAWVDRWVSAPDCTALAVRAANLSFDYVAMCWLRPPAHDSARACLEHFERAASLYNQRVKDAVTGEKRDPDEFLAAHAPGMCYANFLKRFRKTRFDLSPWA